MSEIKSTTSVNIPTAQKPRKNKPAFTAITPMLKAEASAKKMMAYAAGKYVSITNELYYKLNGLLVCLGKTGSTAVYIVMDKDKKVHYIPVMSYNIDIINGPVPMEMSVVEWLRQHETNFMIDKITEDIKEHNYTNLTPVTVNWQKQFGNKENNQKKNKKGKK